MELRVNWVNPNAVLYTRKHLRPPSTQLIRQVPRTCSGLSLLHGYHPSLTKALWGQHCHHPRGQRRIWGRLWEFKSVAQPHTCQDWKAGLFWFQSASSEWPWTIACHVLSDIKLLLLPHILLTPQPLITSDGDAQQNLFGWNNTPSPILSPGHKSCLPISVTGSWGQWWPWACVFTSLSLVCIEGRTAAASCACGEDPMS